ncbi:MAG: LysR family transcriptional regulator [Bilifractor sp.]|jgi:DNA-binding transcriptional LysR family regulator
MDITYDYYRIFYYVAKYKSFTRAASILLNSQPNITRSMNNLEKQLGCKLFIRSNRGIRLTEDGENLYRHVEVAFEQLQMAERELENSTGLRSGSVNVSATETALHGILLPVLRSFHNWYPDIHIRVTNQKTVAAVEAVRNHLSDFAVVTTPAKIEKPLKVTRLIDFQEVLVCSERYSHLASRKHHLSEILSYPIVGLGRDLMSYQFYTELFFQYNLDYNVDIEAATADQLLPMITYDLGIGFVPESLIEDRNLEAKIYRIPLYEEIPARSICLIEQDGATLSAAAGKLRELLLSASHDPAAVDKSL